MKPLRARYSRIKREANALLQRAGVNAPPVQVDSLAKLLGAQIVYRRFEDNVSGLLIRRGSSAVIGVNSKQADVRKRFTIAHEIGHLVLHDIEANEEVHVDKGFHVNLRSSASSTADNVVEIEANAFAAAILMPDHLVRADVQNLTLDFEDTESVRRLAERYEVSNQAMTFRLMNLFSYTRVT